MTTTQTSSAVDRARLLIQPAAICSVTGAIALNALGVWGDGMSNAEDGGLVAFLVVCGFIAVAAAVVFGWLVPRSIAKVKATGASGATGIVLSGTALVLVLAFWSGLPPILAAAGIVLGLAGRDARRGSGMASAAVVIGILALIGDVAVYGLDWLNTSGAL
jgi:hypothetical protein